MTTDMWLRNLAAFGMQSGLLVVGGYLLAKAFRLDEPRAAFAYWRVLLVACLLLPVCQPWQTVVSQTAAISALTDAVTTPVVKTLPDPNAAATAASPSLERLIAIILGVGVVVRAGWLAIGAWVLARIRRDADVLDPVPDAIASAQALVVRPRGYAFPAGSPARSPSASGAPSSSFRRRLLHSTRRCNTQSPVTNCFTCVVATGSFRCSRRAFEPCSGFILACGGSFGAFS